VKATERIRFIVVRSSHWRRGHLFDVHDTATGERLPADNLQDAEEKAEAMNAADRAVKDHYAAGAERLLQSIFGPQG
jgi:hypothetical protein